MREQLTALRGKLQDLESRNETLRDQERLLRQMIQQKAEDLERALKTLSDAHDAKALFRQRAYAVVWRLVQRLSGVREQIRATNLASLLAHAKAYRLAFELKGARMAHLKALIRLFGSRHAHQTAVQLLEAGRCRHASEPERCVQENGGALYQLWHQREAAPGHLHRTICKYFGKGDGCIHQGECKNVHLTPSGLGALVEEARVASLSAGQIAIEKDWTMGDVLVLRQRWVQTVNALVSGREVVAGLSRRDLLIRLEALRPVLLKLEADWDKVPKKEKATRRASHAGAGGV